MTLVPQSACPMDDLQCICSNQELQSRVQTCLASGCTIRQILGMQFRTLDLTVSANKFYSRKETTVHSVWRTHTRRRFLDEKSDLAAFWHSCLLCHISLFGPI